MGIWDTPRDRSTETAKRNFNTTPVEYSEEFTFRNNLTTMSRWNERTHDTVDADIMRGLAFARVVRDKKGNPRKGWVGVTGKERARDIKMHAPGEM